MSFPGGEVYYLLGEVYYLLCMRIHRKSGRNIKKTGLDGRPASPDSGRKVKKGLVKIWTC